MVSSSNGVPYVGGKGDINRKINGFREIFHINNLDWIYTQIFTKNEYHGELSEENKDFISRLQILNARKILKLFYNKKKSILSRADQASILRLALNGKTHTLCSYKEVSEPSEINTTICSDAIEAVTAVKHQCLMKLPIGLGKTDGWVTSFLEFAIADIESRSNENLS